MVNTQPSVILTRPEGRIGPFAAALRAVWPGLAVHHVPLMRIAPVPFDTDLAAFPHIILTSATPLAEVALWQTRPDVTVWCVGRRTAEAVRQAGFRAFSADGAADDLVNQMIAARPEGAILHLRGRHSRGDVAERLQAAGLNCVERVVYDQIVIDPPARLLDLLDRPDPTIVPLFSPRSAVAFSPVLPARATVHVIGISTTVLNLCADWPIASLTAAKTPDHAGMCAATLHRLNTLRDAESA